MPMIKYHENHENGYELFSAFEGEEERSSENDPSSTKDNACKTLPQRYLLVILVCLGFANVYALRVNLSVALVKMVKENDELNSKTTQRPDYNWDTTTQGIILSSFFYGYIFSQIPAGYIATRFRGKNIFGIGVFFSGLLTLLIPHATRTHLYLLIAVRVAMGLFEGFTFPASYAILGKWAPPLERTFMKTICTSGLFLGTVIGMALSGVIVKQFGWTWVFYIFGFIAIIWCFFWFLLVTDSPMDHPRISQNEKNYIKTSLADDRTETNIQSLPWRKILTSVPVWAIVAAHTTESWGWTIFVTTLPTYFKTVLNFSVQESGMISALPYFALFVIMLSSGRLADFLRKEKNISTTTLRKTHTVTGFAAQATFLAILGYTTNTTFVIILITLAVGMCGLAWSGFPINYLDIAPRYAGFIMGFSNTIATMSAIVSPTIAGALTPNQTQQEWRIVFFITASVYVCGAVIYAVFASSERQEWAAGDEEGNHMTSSNNFKEQQESLLSSSIITENND